MNPRLIPLALFGAVAIFLIVQASRSDWFTEPPDEGARLSDAMAHVADNMRSRGQAEWVFVYTPFLGTDQTYSVDVAATRYCPSPPCQQSTDDPMAGTATVQVERGQSGTGYSFPRSLAVPTHLSIRKRDAPVHITLRRQGNVIEAVSID